MDILSRVQQITDEIIAWRREIHRWPELGGQEVQTCALIVETLEKLGVAYQIVDTGVIGFIKGGQPGKTIALRADLDCLPVQEDTGLEFSSQRPGLMHACGHDAHTAMLLGAAKVLVQLAPSLHGNIKLFFQPSEESHPGGALKLIAAGALEQVDLVVGLHVLPLLPKGSLGVKAGTIMAAADTFELKIVGRGGHGAAPHLTIDPIVIAAEVILGLQTIASRRVDPQEPVVITVAAIHGGEVNNIIPQEVYLKGTVRTLSPELRAQAPSLLEQKISGIVQSAGGDFSLDYRLGYPALVNDQQAVQLVTASALKVLGPDGVSNLEKASMSGEDFAYYAQQVPACFAFLGTGITGQEPVHWHSPHFIVDEETLPIGTAILVQTAVDFITS